MRVHKYTYEGLAKHTASIRSQVSGVMHEHRSLLDQAFSDFSEYLEEIEQQPPSLERNVRMMLSCKLFNHVYAGIILAECGLIADASMCERSALETVAFHWLITVEPGSASEYETGKVPRPVEVRRRLESHGVDISNLRELYSSGSQLTHVGRKAERFNSRLESPLKGALLFGGASSLSDQSEMVHFLPHLLYLFAQPMKV